MKKLSLLFIITLLGYYGFSQNKKCLAFSNTIIVNTKAKIQQQSVDYNDVYFIKAEFPETCDLDALKMICDTTFGKTIKASFNWRLNSDKNNEKEFIVNGKKVLVTVYFNDKFLYFEFSKD